jgi:hypothetical protein
MKDQSFQITFTNILVMWNMTKLLVVWTFVMFILIKNYYVLIDIAYNFWLKINTRFNWC